MVDQPEGLSKTRSELHPCLLPLRCRSEGCRIDTVHTCPGKERETGGGRGNRVAHSQTHRVTEISLTKRPNRNCAVASESLMPRTVEWRQGVNYSWMSKTERIDGSSEKR